jgi:2-hydroxy-3-keto-5-methylthiopentenyl-1-phosphate phosphatase
MGDLAVLCDFDGTITTTDTAEQVLIRFAIGDWLELDRQLERGELTLEECMRRQFAMVRVPEADVLAELDGVVQFRPNFPALTSACATSDASFAVVSAGLDFVIRHFLSKMGYDSRLEVYSGHAHFNGRFIEFKFPELLERDSRNFKDDFVRHQKREGKRVIYIGDGLSDLEASHQADFIFAVRGRRLSRLCEEEHLRHVDFDDFREIAWRIAKCADEGDYCHLLPSSSTD